MEVDNAQHLVVRDISLQGTRLALPGAAEDIVHACGDQNSSWKRCKNDRRQQHTRFSEQQHCLFIHSDWLGRIEASLQDVEEQIRQRK